MTRTETIRRSLGLLAPPVPVDRRSRSMLIALAVIAVVAGYQGSIPTASLTYVAKEFGASTASQSHALAFARVDIVLALFAVQAADRFGRRRMLLGVSIAAPLLTAACALATNLATFAVLQVVSRSMVTATMILVTVLTVEELPAATRTWASAALVVAAALGTALSVGAVFFADRGLRVWRLFYLPPLLGLVLMPGVARRLPESSRFLRAASLQNHENASRSEQVREFFRRVSLHRHRLVVVSLFGALLAFENTPTRQLQNEHLRLDLHFSSRAVSIFTVVTNFPGLVGLVIGGLVGHRFGHRRVLAFTTAGFGIGDAGLFLSHGSAVWLWSVFGALAGAASIPILAILTAEIFPTAFRSTANGLSTLASRAGGALGLLFVGVMSGHVSRGTAIAMATVAVAFALVLIPLLPETLNKELEELNVEDAQFAAESFVGQDC